MSETQEVKTIIKWGKIKPVCPCGGYYDKTTKCMHRKTVNHKLYEETPIGEVFRCYINWQGQAVQTLNTQMQGGHIPEIYEIIKT